MHTQLSRHRLKCPHAPLNFLHLPHELDRIMGDGAGLRDDNLVRDDARADVRARLLHPIQSLRLQLEPGGGVAQLAISLIVT